MFVFASFCTYSIKSSWNPLSFLGYAFSCNYYFGQWFCYFIFVQLRNFLPFSWVIPCTGIQLEDWGQLICWWQWCVLLFSSLPLFQLIYFVKCRQTPLQLNSLEPCSSSKGKRKFCHGLLTSSMKCEMWHFQVIVMQWQQRNVQKACCMCKVHMLSCLLDPILFFWWTFLLPSSLILFPLFSINMGRCLYEHQY